MKIILLFKYNHNIVIRYTYIFFKCTKENRCSFFKFFHIWFYVENSWINEQQFLNKNHFLQFLIPKRCVFFFCRGIIINIYQSNSSKIVKNVFYFGYVYSRIDICCQSRNQISNKIASWSLLQLCSLMNIRSIDTFTFNHNDSGIR